MKKRNRMYLLLVVIMLSIMCLTLVACSSQEPADTQPSDQQAVKGQEATEESRYGGTLVVAKPISPANLDSDKSTATEISEMMNHVYEGLFEMNEEFEPTPHLAESFEIKDEGKTYDVKLRQGVKFHNGKEMTSEDVYASFQRWLKNNGAGKLVSPQFDTLEVVGPYEVAFKFKQPFAPFLNILASHAANQKLVIRPKEIIDEYQDNVIEEHIGTGPYQFVESIPDQYLKLKRFDDYVSSTLPSSGFAGKRTAYADELMFRFVSEEAVRVAGVQTDEYQYSEQVSTDQYTLLKSDSNVQPIVVKPYRQMMIVINSGQPPFNDIYARQALAAAINMEELGSAMVGDKEFWRISGSLFSEGNPWYDPDAGKGVYNINDVEKAKELLGKSGYDGTPIVIVNGRDDNIESQGAIALKSQLEKAGFKVDVQLFDRATVVERRAQLDTWNLHLTVFQEINADPQVFAAWVGTKGWISNWDDEYSHSMDAIYARMLGEVDYNKRYEIVKEWYNEFWTSVPYVKTVNISRLNVANKSLQGCQVFVSSYFWNTWLEKE